MFLPAKPPKMYALRNQTVSKFVNDTHTGSIYTFNSLGYRSNREFDIVAEPIVILGNTLSFGLGLDAEYTYSGILDKQVPYPVYNFSWARYGHENIEQLELLDNILSLVNPKLLIFQVNNLNVCRIGDQVSFDNPDEVVLEKFNEFYPKLKSLLANTPNVLLHWAYEHYNIDSSDFLIYNKYHVDSVDFYNGTEYKPTMGKMSHKLIAHKILREIK